MRPTDKCLPADTYLKPLYPLQDKGADNLIQDLNTWAIKP
ncbi:hypothetical protein N836_16300 [Leptolyngbya sp. Heron Island J]|nr:hypothetical protein N836_16300 [Leptolyngbya sp. Heron Island J]